MYTLCVMRTDLCRSRIRADTKYSVNVFGMFEGGESLPLAGEEKTTLSDGPPDPGPFEPSGNKNTLNSL